MSPVDLQEVHVLIIEDEPLNARLIVALMGLAGIKHSHISRSGLEVNDVVSSMPRLDLVLLDLQLPGTDGFELIGELRQQDVFANVPIVAVTARVMLDLVARAKALGFDGYIGKPLHFDRFPEQVRRILAGEPVVADLMGWPGAVRHGILARQP